MTIKFRKITGAFGGVPTIQWPNTSLEHYRYINLLGWVTLLISRPFMK
jgi:hypothetical protein